MTQQDDSIRLRPDGSIDFAHYMQRGRVMRSEQAHRLLRGATVPAPLWSVRGLLGLVPRFAS